MVTLLGVLYGLTTAACVVVVFLISAGRAEVAPDPAAEVNPAPDALPAPVVNRKVKWALPAAPRAVPIAPTPLATESVLVNLPGKVADTCVGGGGRFLFLKYADRPELAAFDVSTGKVAKTLPAAPAAVFAAGMSILVVIDPDTGSAATYDLPSLDARPPVPLPVNRRVRGVCMGSASAGPLLVEYDAGGPAGGGAVTFLDPTTLAEYEVTTTATAAMSPKTQPVTHYRASADGRLFGGWQATWGASGIGWVTELTADGVTLHREITASDFVLPGQDKTVTVAHGRYTPAMVKLGALPPAPAVTFPAVHGNLLVTLELAKGGQFADRSPRTAEVRAAGDPAVLASLDRLDPPYSRSPGRTATLSPDKRCLLIPAAKVFVALIPTDDALILRRFDPPIATEESGLPYLFLASRQPSVVPGRPYRHQLDVRSKAGGVTCALVSGPPGLQVSPTGLVTWTPPAAAGDPPRIEVTLADASGQKVAVSAQLSFGVAETDPPTVVRPPAKPLVTPRTTLTAHEAVSLPDQADASCLGAGGRLVFFRIPAKKQIVAVDLSLGKVVHGVPLASANATFAAGANSLVVYDPAADVFRRWTLDPFELVSSAKSTLGGSPVSLCMGHASEGPLLVCGKGVSSPRNHAFVDPTTFRAAAVTTANDKAEFSLPAFDNPRVRASADGRLFAWFGGGREPFGGWSARLTGRTAELHRINWTPWQLIPGGDDMLFAESKILQADFKALEQPLWTSPRRMLIPATAGQLYLDVTARPHDGRYLSPFDLNLRAVGSTVMVKLDPNVNQLPKEYLDQFGFDAPPLPLVDRFVLNPDAGVYGVVNRNRDTLHLHPLDVKAALEKTGNKYATVVSRPPVAVPGATWTYAPEVWAGGGKPALTVASGPAGLQATDGTLTWAVPKDAPAGEHAVTLALSAGEYRTTQTFTVFVRTEK